MTFTIAGREFRDYEYAHLYQDEYERLCQHFNRTWKYNRHTLEIVVQVSEGENGLPTFSMSGYCDGHIPRGWFIFSMNNGHDSRKDCADFGHLTERLETYAGYLDAQPEYY